MIFLFTNLCLHPVNLYSSYLLHHTFIVYTLVLCLDHGELQGPHMHSFKERDELLHSITDCLIQEYEDASTSDSVLSYPLRHMLIPHMESLLKVIIPACALGEDIGKV